MQSGRRKTPERPQKKLRGTSKERGKEIEEGFQVTWSIVGLGFALGMVSMLALGELEKRPPPFECPSNVEVRTLVGNIGQAQYYDDMIRVGLDRLDIIASSRYADVQDIGMKPYHWAVLKSEAMKYTLHKRVSIASLLRGENLNKYSDGAVASTPPPDQESLEDFFNIPVNQYIPTNLVPVTITTICTGTLLERIGGLFNAVVLGRALSAKIHVIWVQNNECGAKMSSLFSVSDRFSYSTLPPDKALSTVFYSKVVLEDFTGVFTNPKSMLHGLMGEDIPAKGPASLWWVKNARNMTLDPKGELIEWVRGRGSLDLKTHVLYEVSELADGVGMERVKDAVEYYAMHPSNEVMELVKRVAETNDFTQYNTLAVYDEDVPRLRPNDLFGKKMLLLTTPQLPPTNSTPSTVPSLYNASHPHSRETTDLHLFASSTLLASHAIPIFKQEEEHPPKYKTELVLASILCPSGIICPKASVVDRG